MHSRVRSASLTETLGIRVTEDERSTLEVLAEEAGISLSEWCRQLLLDGLAMSPETRLVLSEVLALRKVFLALMLDQIQGQKPTEPRVLPLAYSGDLLLPAYHVQADRKRTRLLDGAPGGDR